MVFTVQAGMKVCAGQESGLNSSLHGHFENVIQGPSTKGRRPGWTQLLIPNASHVDSWEFFDVVVDVVVFVAEAAGGLVGAQSGTAKNEGDSNLFLGLIIINFFDTPWSIKMMEWLWMI